MVNDADIITSIRNIRNIVVALDSIGFPIEDILKDEEIAEEIPEDLPQRIINLSSEIHNVLQNIEKSKRYKEAVKNLCDIKERKDG